MLSGSVAHVAANVPRPSLPSVAQVAAKVPRPSLPRPSWTSTTPIVISSAASPSATNTTPADAHSWLNKFTQKAAFWSKGEEQKKKTETGSRKQFEDDVDPDWTPIFPKPTFKASDYESTTNADTTQVYYPKAFAGSQDTSSSMTKWSASETADIFTNSSTFNVRCQFNSLLITINLLNVAPVEKVSLVCHIFFL